MDEVFLVTIWAIIALVVHVPFAVYGFWITRSQYKVSLPYIPILKYSAVTLLSSVITYLVSLEILTYPQSIYEFLPEIISLLLLGGVLYFGLTYLIDIHTRKLFKSILKEILKR